MLQNPELHYLDNAATTIVAPEVADVINKAMREHWANPSSLYAPGARSEEALNAARAAVARTLGCKAKELYFTSCGSESNNLALLGAVQTRTFGKGIVVSGFEHPSVQKPLERLAAMGYDVTVVAPGPDGTLDIDRMLEHVDKNTILVACMMVNNEIGTVQPVEQLGKLLKAKAPKALFHIDAVQGLCRVRLTPKKWNCDLMSVSGHKIGAPKGIGALYIGPRVRNPRPLLPGGGQEMGLRSGTEATAQIAGFAKAVELRWDHLEDKLHHMAEVKAYAVEKLTAIPDLQIIGSGKAPHVLSVSMAGWPSQNVVTDLGSQGICVSAGSACHHGKSSQVVSALGLPKRVAAGVIRLSFGPETTFAEIDACAEALRNHHDHRMPML